MARRKKGGGGAGGALLVVVAFFFVVIASIPKEVWVVLGVLAGAGLLWWVIHAYKASTSKALPAQVNNWEDEARRVREKREAERVALISPPTRSSTPGFSCGLSQLATKAAVAPSTKVSAVPASAPKSIPASEGRWIEAGKEVEIAGVKIPGGLIYVGTYVGQPLDSPDPCLINPVLSVASNPSYTDLGYWPSYTTITPSARRGYLNWLAGGRKGTSTVIGYVFLFFYGIERRLFLEREKINNQERLAIEAELVRLLSLYGSQYSFSNYCTALLDFVRLMWTPKQLYNAPLPTMVRSYELPLYLCLAIGETAVDEVPIPASLALAWVRMEPSIYLRTPATRCPDQFEASFKERYRQTFGEGLKLAKNRSKLKIVYKPASALFKGPVTLGFEDTPDVRALTAPVKKLNAVAEQAQDDIDAYSRYVGRFPEAKGTLDAALLLPPELWPDKPKDAVVSLAAKVAAEPFSLTFQALQDRFNVKTPLTRERALILLNALSVAGVSAEPDLTSGARLPKLDDHMVLFKAASNDTSGADPQFKIAALTLQLAAAIAGADGEFSDPEVAMLEHQVQTWAHLSESQRARLSAHLKLLALAPVSLASLKKKLEPLEPRAKDALGTFLATVAAADGAVSPKEIKLLESAYKALGLDPVRVFSEVHQATVSIRPSAPAVASDGADPVLIADGSSDVADFTIPQKPQHSTTALGQPPIVAPLTAASPIALDADHLAAAGAASERVAKLRGSTEAADAVPIAPKVIPLAATSVPVALANPPAFQLDHAKLAALRKETERVSSMLAGIFADDAVAPVAGETAAVESLAAPPVKPSAEAMPVPVAPANSPAFQLDHAKLAALRKETERASSMLAGIFADDAVAPGAGETAAVESLAAPPVKPSAEVEGLFGLNAAHSAFARMLLTRPSWTRAELSDVAADLELMLDGALEQVNDAVFDKHDIPFCEGEDPIEINLELLEKMET